MMNIDLQKVDLKKIVFFRHVMSLIFILPLPRSLEHWAGQGRDVVLLWGLGGAACFSFGMGRPSLL